MDGRVFVWRTATLCVVATLADSEFKIKEPINLTRMRTLLAVCALALPIPAAIAGCGSDDSSSEDPQTVLDETFNNDTTVSSGDLALTASVKADGAQGGEFEASLSGPFQSDPDNPNTIPQLDWTATATGSGAGQTIDFSGEAVVTDDNAYVVYQDQAYEVGTDAFTQLRDQVESQASAAGVGSPTSFSEGCKQAVEQAGGDSSACDIDFESWLTNLTNEGTEDVGGTPTVHVSGDADVSKILTDIGNIASSIPSASSSGFDPSQLSLASGAVTDATIDVYSGTDDHVLRKLDVSLTIDPSALGAAAAGVGTITVSFSVEIDGLNETQTIEAPANPKPISDLLSNLGIDLGALGGLGGTSGSSGSGSSSGGAEYLACIQQATTPDDINACSAQL
jgi:hypothetical protein